MLSKLVEGFSWSEGCTGHQVWLALTRDDVCLLVGWIYNRLHNSYDWTEKYYRISVMESVCGNNQENRHFLSLREENIPDAGSGCNIYHNLFFLYFSSVLPSILLTDWVGQSDDSGIVGSRHFHVD